MRSTGDDVIAAREYLNVNFLIEQQLRLLEDLDRHGLDRSAAQELLRRLVRQGEDLRLGTVVQKQLRMA